MANDSVRAALEAKKAEIEAALRELDRIEALAGLRAAPPPTIDGKSFSQAVLDSISEAPKSIGELAELLGLSESQVYHALTSHRLRKLVGTKKINGKKVYYVKKPGGAGDTKRPSMSTAIISYLAEHPGRVMRSGEIAQAIDGTVDSSASNFYGAVSSTLSTLVRNGRIIKAPSGGFVSLVQQEMNYDDP